MVHTRSMKLKMEVSKEITDYFNNLIEPLATKNFIEEMFGKFKQEIIDLNKKLSVQNEKINELEAKVNSQAVVIDNLMIMSDNNQQYQRRSLLRFHNVEIDENEDEKILETKLDKCFSDMNITVEKDEIDRFHRIGKAYVNKSGKTTKSIIVKFKSWSTRQRVYQARPKRHVESSKKPGFSVTLDLTQRRYNLLKLARDSINNRDDIDYAYADKNCSLAFRFKNGAIKYFNSKCELHKTIA